MIMPFAGNMMELVSVLGRSTPLDCELTSRIAPGNGGELLLPTPTPWDKPVDVDNTPTSRNTKVCSIHRRERFRKRFENLGFVVYMRNTFRLNRIRMQGMKHFPHQTSVNTKLSFLGAGWYSMFMRFLGHPCL
jgi:hypothetical protein